VTFLINAIVGGALVFLGWMWAVEHWMAPAKDGDQLGWLPSAASRQRARFGLIQSCGPRSRTEGSRQAAS
jgi:hypothetical protein